MSSVWYWPPNAISEKIEFLTDIRASRTAEIRDSYKDATNYPKYGYRVHHEIGEAMIDLYRSDPLGEYLVPEWSTATVSKNVIINLGQTIIPVEDSSVYEVGGLVFIGNGKHEWEQATVGSLGVGTITLTTGTVNAYSGSQFRAVFVAPLISCILPSGINFNSQFRVINLTCNFLNSATIDIAENIYPEYLSLPLVTDGKIGVSQLSGSVRQFAELFDSGHGAYDLIAQEEYSKRYGEFSFYDSDYQSRLNRRKFLHFMRGMDGEMWVRSGQRDLNLLSGFSAASISLSVKPFTSVSRMIGKHIYLKEGGQIAAREVTSATDVSDSEQTLFLSSPPGFDGTISTMVSLLHKSRFDQDMFDISYRFTPFGLKSSLTAKVVEVP